MHMVDKKGKPCKHSKGEKHMNGCGPVPTPHIDTEGAQLLTDREKAMKDAATGKKKRKGGAKLQLEALQGKY